MRYLFLLFLLTLFGESQSQNLDCPGVVISGLEYEVNVSMGENSTTKVFLNEEELAIQGTSTNEGVILVSAKESSDIQLFIDNELVYEKHIHVLPGWISLIPPLIAILLALLFKEVFISLFLGVFIGALIPNVTEFGINGLFKSVMRVIDHYILNALNDAGHLSVIVFSMLIGGMVSLISKNGGMAGVVNRISKHAYNRKSGQTATWLLGIVIFFDDYANTLIVGNTMRPITDKLKISREKLSYLVDSTAAPIAAIAFVTTWVGAELGYIQDGISQISAISASPYQIFLNSIEYSYYPILTLLFILMLIRSEKDFGPMFMAERNVVEKDSEMHQLVNVKDDEMKEFEPAKNINHRSYNAVIPVSIVVIGTVLGLFYTGWDSDTINDEGLTLFQKISNVIGGSDAYLALLWSSLGGVISAVILNTGQRLLSISESMDSLLKGFKTMLPAMIILVLAWSLSGVTADLRTADYLSNSLSETISPVFFPLIVFVMSALVSFSTGSSWGSMAILYPIVLPLTWTICQSHGFSDEMTMPIFYNVVSTVLAGSVLGDHCSPISDTTILSSLASSCDHIEHVRTQLPYALTVGVISMLVGTLPSALGSPFFINLLLGLSLMWLCIRFFGKKVSTG